MRVFMDWEFLEDGHTIAPISVALVREDGREYYAIFDDHDTIRRAVAHPWLRQNVVNSLPIRPGGDSGDKRAWRFDYDHPDIACVKDPYLIAAAVRRFIVDTPNVELWAWYGAFDHLCLAWLYGPMSDLPTGIPMWTNDVRQEAQRLGDPQLPEQESGVHNALADARHIKVMADHLDALRLGEKPWRAGDRTPTTRTETA